MRRAATADLPIKYLCSDTISGMRFETRAKLGCQIKSLKRMAQRSRQAVNRHPCNPRDLEQIHLPALSLVLGLRILQLRPDAPSSLEPLPTRLLSVILSMFMEHGSPRPASLLSYSLFNVHGIFDDGCLRHSSRKDNCSLYQHPLEAQPFWTLLSQECAVFGISDI